MEIKAAYYINIFKLFRIKFKITVLYFFLIREKYIGPEPSARSGRKRYPYLVFSGTIGIKES